jgi:hypothetical protein
VCEPSRGPSACSVGVGSWVHGEVQDRHTPADDEGCGKALRRDVAIDDQRKYGERLVCWLANDAGCEVSRIAHTADQAFAHAATESSETVFLDLRLPAVVAPDHIAQLAQSARAVTVLISVATGTVSSWNPSLSSTAYTCGLSVSLKRVAIGGVFATAAGLTRNGLSTYGP